MGKGDKKSRRGKIAIGSFGVRRQKKNTPVASVTSEKATAKPKVEKDKAPAAKKRVVKNPSDKK